MGFYIPTYISNNEISSFRPGYIGFMPYQEKSFPDERIWMTTPQTTVRKKNYKLIHFWDGDRNELYDLEKDVGEENDLCQVQALKCEEMKYLLDEWVAQTGARTPKMKKDFIMPPLRPNHSKIKPKRKKGG